jgi:hypothetical protein
MPTHYGTPSHQLYSRNSESQPSAKKFLLLQAVQVWVPRAFGIVDDVQVSNSLLIIQCSTSYGKRASSRLSHVRSLGAAHDR